MGRRRGRVTPRRVGARRQRPQPTPDAAEDHPEGGGDTHHDPAGDGDEHEPGGRPGCDRVHRGERDEQFDGDAEDPRAESGGTRIHRAGGGDGDGAGDGGADDHHRTADGRLGVRESVYASGGRHRGGRSEDRALPHPWDAAASDTGGHLVRCGRHETHIPSSEGEVVG